MIKLFYNFRDRQYSIWDCKVKQNEDGSFEEYKDTFIASAHSFEDLATCIQYGNVIEIEMGVDTNWRHT